VLVAHAYNPSNKGGRDRRITVGGQPRQIIHETLSQKKKNHKKGLVEWLKVWALSSSPRTAKKKKRKKNLTVFLIRCGTSSQEGCREGRRL
jgi:hypothetical protein